jgi:hypothetical protein
MKNRETFAQELCDILEKNKVIAQKESEAMHKTFKDSEYDQFDNFLLAEGFIEKSDLLRALSQYYSIPSFDVTGYFFNSLLIREYPKDFLISNAIIPLESEDDGMVIVIAANPDAIGLESRMREHASYNAEFLVGLKRDILSAIIEFYDKSITEDAETEDLNMNEEMRLEKEAIENVEEIEELSYGSSLYRDEDKE